MSLKVSILDAAMPHEMDSTYLSQEQRRGSPLLRSRQRHSLFALVLVGCAGFFLCYLLETAFATSCLVPSLPSFLDSSTHLTSKILRSPENVKIIGLMFYGRAQFTNVLEWSVVALLARLILINESLIVISETIFVLMADGKIWQHPAQKIFILTNFQARRSTFHCQHST